MKGKETVNREMKNPGVIGDDWQCRRQGGRIHFKYNLM